MTEPPPPDPGGAAKDWRQAPGAGTSRRAEADGRASRGVAWLGAGAWVNRGALLGTIVVLAAVLSPRELGVLSAAVVVANIFLVFNDAGFHDATVFGAAGGRPVVETAMCASWVTSVMVAISLASLAPTAARFLHAPAAARLMQVECIAVVLGGLAEVPLAVLTRSLAWERRFVFDAVPALVGSAVTITAALSGAGMWSLVAGDAVRATVALAVVLALQPERVWPRWHPEVARRLWPYARGALASSAMNFILLNVDYILVGRLLGPTALGYYSLAFRIAILPFLLVGEVFNGVAFPLYSRMHPDQHRVAAAFTTAVRLGTSVCLLLAAGLFALAPWVRILGDKWAPSVPVLRLLGIYVGLRCLSGFITPLARATGHPAGLARLVGLWVAMLATGIVLFGQTVSRVAGVQAAVAAVLVVLSGLWVGRISRISPLALAGAVGRPVAAAVVAGACGAALAHQGGFLADAHSLPGMIVTALAVTVAYLGLLGASGALPLEDLRLMGVGPSKAPRLHLRRRLRSTSQISRPPRPPGR